jgi:predicted N-acetyltransferase YhbS
VGRVAPVPLDQNHDASQFDCGNTALLDWLKKKALRNQISGASRTFVICENNRVIAYYSLAAGSIEHKYVSSRLKRNQPDPIPVVILARLAVDVMYQNQGLGLGLVKDAIQKVLHASQSIGIRAILVHAIDDTAKAFYENKCGFFPSEFQERTLMIALKDIQI